jgi:hypothetical protein
MIAALNWVHEAFEEGPLKHRSGDWDVIITKSQPACGKQGTNNQIIPNHQYSNFMIKILFFWSLKFGNWLLFDIWDLGIGI